MHSRMPHKIFEITLAIFFFVIEIPFSYPPISVGVVECWGCPLLSLDIRNVCYRIRSFRMQLCLGNLFSKLVQNHN